MNLCPSQLFSAAAARVLDFAASPQELSTTLAILYASYCQRLKVDKAWRRQFLVLFLSALYWPMYTRTKHWNPPMTSNFFKVVLAKSIALSDMDDSNPKIARFVKRAKQCGFQSIVEEDVRGQRILLLFSCTRPGVPQP